MIYDVGKRKRKAYWVSFRIIWRYLKLFIVRRFYRQTYYEKKLKKAHQKNAKLLKETFLQLNGLFIKVGQLLSTISRILPEEYVQTLESLQDNTPSTKFDIIKNTIENELNNQIFNLFEDFSENPIASASIGQVHRAKLKSGEQVAVKIKHPFIDELAKSDLKIIENLVKISMKLFNVQGLEGAFEQVKIMIIEELDYVHEAQSIKLIKDNCRKIKGLIIPKVYDPYSTDQILTSSYCRGVKITNQKQLEEWQIDRDKLSHQLILAFCEMILNHGIYHADPHPGNLLVNEYGEIILLDFGAVAKLDDRMKANIPMLIQTILLNDQDGMLDVLRKMGFIGSGKDAKKLVGQLITAISEFLESGINLAELDLDNIQSTKLFQLIREVKIRDFTTSLTIPKDWFLLQRTILLLYGVATEISKDYDPLNTVQPYLQKFLLKRENIQKLLWDILKKQAAYAISLPKKINMLLDIVNRGELEVNIQKNSRVGGNLPQQILFGAFGLICFTIALVSNIYSREVYEEGFLVAGTCFGVIFIFYSLFFKNAN